MKLFKRVTSTLAAIALLSSSFVAMQAGAEDVPYLDIYNSQGVYGVGDNAIAISGTRTAYSGDPERGSYSTLTGSFVHICEGSNAVATTWADNIEAGRMTQIEVEFMPDENTQYVHLYTYYTRKMTCSIDLTTLGDVVKVGKWNHLKLIADTGVLSRSNNGVTIDRIPSVMWINGVQVNEYSMSKCGDAGTTLAIIRERLAAGSSQYIRLRFDAKSGTTTTVGIDDTRIKTIDATSIVDADYDSYAFPVGSIIKMTASVKAGLAGRADTDKSYVLTPSASDGYMELRAPSNRKYVKQEYDILPGEGFTYAYAKSRNQTLTYNMFGLTDNETEDNQRLKKGQWNHLAFISYVDSLDLTTGAAKVITEGYANGVLVCTTTRTWDPDSDANHLDFTDGKGLGRTYFPLRFGLLPAGVDFTIDNLDISVSDTKPTIKNPILVTDKNSMVSVTPSTRYGNGTIGIPEGESIEVGDIVSAGGSVRAYEDATMASELDSDLVLEEGNFVVATDANGIVTYYDVINEEYVERNETILDINFNDESYTGTVGKVNAFTVKSDYGFVVDGGKEDKALSISTRAGSASTKDGYVEFEPMDISLDNFIISFNVMPKSDNIKQIFVGTAQSAALTSYISGSSLVKDQWNKVDVLVKKVNKGHVTGYATIFPVTVTIYINGKEYATNLAREPRSSGDDKTLLRFAVEDEASRSVTALFDDIKVVQANVPLTLDTAMPTVEIDSALGYTEGNNLYANEDVMIGDISASEGELKVYTDTTYTSQKDDSDFLEEGDVVVVALGSKYAYYKVFAAQEPEDTNTTLLDINFDDGTVNGTVGSVYKTKGSFDYVVAGGKSDKAISITNAEGAPDGYIEFNNIKTNLDYTIIKFNLMPKIGEFNRLFVGTSQHAAVSPDLYVGTLNEGEWNNVVIVLENSNPKNISGTNTVYPVKQTTYVNGKKVSTTDMSPKTVKDGESPLRFISYATSSSTKSTCYIDDLSIVQTNMPSVVEAIDLSMPTIAIDEAQGYVEDSTVWVRTECTPADLSASVGTIAVYTDNTFATTLDESDALVKGNVIVITNGTKYAYYTVDEPVFAINSSKLTMDGTTASKTELDLGEYTYTVKSNNPTASAVTIRPAIAVYDGDGRLVRVAITSKTIAACTTDETAVTLDLDEDVDDGYIKTFIWDENMKPYELDRVKVLIIGNSITKHAPASTLGWKGTWGMAATSEDKDYVHLLAKQITQACGSVEFKCVNIAEFEKYFYDWTQFEASKYDSYVDYDADVIVCTIGANVKNGSNEQDSSYENDKIFTADHYTNIVNHFNADGNAVVISGLRMLTSNGDVISAIQSSVLANGWASVDIGSVNGVSAEEKALGISLGTFTEDVSDGVLGHPGDSGMAQIASAIFPLLKTAVESVR